MNLKIKRALISVSDKSSLFPLIEVLKDWDVEIIASGGTKAQIEKWGFKVTALEKITGNPSVFDGRVKSLSFEISSGLLFKRDDRSHCRQAEELGIKPIDLVVCNLYPFLEKVKQEVSNDELLENIDIGGPTMIRAAAKNHQGVCVLSCPEQYDELIGILKRGEGAIDLAHRRKWALAAFKATAHYESLVATQLQKRWDKESVSVGALVENPVKLRYGENPTQKAWAFVDPINKGLLSHPPLQGKALSYNNLLDVDAACRCAHDLQKWDGDKQIAVIVKHGNPCGQAASACQLTALQLAFKGDLKSSFGGVIAFNSPVKKQTVQWLMDKFIEVIAAPSFDLGALELLKEKKNLRVLVQDKNLSSPTEVRSIWGGWLVQREEREENWELQPVTEIPFPREKESLARFAVACVKHFKSNAISLVAEKKDDFFLIGAGMGAPNRNLALKQAMDLAVENGYESLLNQAVLA
ncbi:MAG: bifunctional phosphoribosylaminoimidazolecarboxamide formyltransferase/IMP cyclohydrolase, partial [Halobacteriovoraceae bacterium]|nr:bifunctional phosphoribosylaminoimidazolecarboxamide formyltransferase/IMP cyclohydrolase [Halobacteriovoraceae bacterium]